MVQASNTVVATLSDQAFWVVQSVVGKLPFVFELLEAQLESESAFSRNLNWSGIYTIPKWIKNMVRHIDNMAEIFVQLKNMHMFLIESVVVGSTIAAVDIKQFSPVIFEFKLLFHSDVICEIHAERLNEETRPV